MNFNKQIIERRKISPAKGIWNPPNDWNPESKFHLQEIWNPEQEIQNSPRRGILTPRSQILDYLTSDERLASTASFSNILFLTVKSCFKTS